MSQNALPRDTILFGERGSYCIETVVGRGGFGITYRASAAGDGLPPQVAIKEFFPKEMCSRTPDPNSFDVVIDSVDKFDTINQLRDRFIKESRNIERCNHPSIVHVLDTVECNGTAYMVMELIQGSTLKQLLANAPQGIELDWARTIVTEVAKALQYLHNHKITHLDVKPDNIMVDSAYRRVVLIDFGLSRQYNDDGSSDSQVLTAVSKGYAAPEQYLGQTEFSPQSDVYSLGATLYKLITGKTPPEPLALKQNPGLLTFQADVPQSVRQAITRAMAYDHNARIRTADEFVRILEGKQITRPIVEEKPKPVKPKEIKDPEVPGPSHPRLMRFIKAAVLNVLLGLVAIWCDTTAYDIMGASWRTYKYLLLVYNDEAVIYLAVTGALATLGILARGLKVKMVFLVITALAAGAMAINML